VSYWFISNLNVNLLPRISVDSQLANLLQDDLTALGLTLPSGAADLLVRYLGAVLETNQVMNLTSITDPVDAVHKHLADSLAALALPSLMAQSKMAVVWADVGSGAGFPGLALTAGTELPLMHLIESTGKKAHFLNTTVAALGLLKRVQVHATRAETLAQPNPGPPDVPRGTPLRGACDAVFFRGVSRLSSLVELGAPLLKLGGLLIAYKGPKADEELVEASKSMKELRMVFHERHAFILPGALEARVLLCLKKNGETPKRYPRPVGLAQKEPI
jgi:16S rRNA (guanine527-N7)-methyltransferase